MALAFVTLAGAVASHAEAPMPAVVPEPARMQVEAGEVVVRAIVAAPGDPEARGAAVRLADLLKRSPGAQLPVVVRSSAARIVFEHSRDTALADEGYRITSTADEIRVIARTNPGLQHGATTVWQLASADIAGVRIPRVRIDDAPRFRWRGLMLDSARHFQSPAAVRSLLDAMAAHKLNVLHWHLTDDQGWRIEIRKYPRLTQVSAWRVPAGAARDDIDPRTGKARLYGGFYSQATIRALVKYAADRGITIIPEIDLPGHATAAIAAYPKLAAIDAPLREVPADWGIYPNVLNLDESTFRFVEDVLDEVMALFPSTFIHVGGDEVVHDQWEATARGRERLKQLGLADAKAVQPYFTQRVGRYLQSRGRRMVGWDEILEPGLGSGAVVMSWRGTAGAEKASREGFDTVVAAHPTLYFDNRQANNDTEPPGRVKVISLADVYAFEPMPAGADAASAAHVLGVQANVWTEHIRTEERMFVMTFPRAAAVAELGWSPPAKKDFAAFQRRLDVLLARYPAIGLGEAARQELRRRAPASGEESTRSSRFLELCTQDIALGLEDDAPIAGPRAVFDIDIQKPCWWFRGVALEKFGALRAKVGQVPFNFQIGEAVKKIVFPASTHAGDELQVRIDSCEGAPVAVASLDAAAKSTGVSALADLALPRLEGRHDLCLRFAQRAVDPMWAIDSLQLLERTP